MNLNFDPNPQRWGPGVWFVFHTLAANINDMQSFNNFKHTVETIAKNIKCERCHNHANQYIRDYPLNPSLMYQRNEAGQIIGPFKWTYDFHNKVNSRLGKEILSFSTAWDMYHMNDTCANGDCRATNNQAYIPPSSPAINNYSHQPDTPYFTPDNRSVIPLNVHDGLPGSHNRLPSSHSRRRNYRNPGISWH